MGVNTLNHFNIHSSDVEGTKDFFVDVLGFKIMKRPPFAFPGYWLGTGKIPTVHLIGRPTAKAKGTGAIDHVAFLATGLKSMIARLEKLGIETEHRRVPDQNLHQIFLFDPNGVKIELNYPAKEAIALDAEMGRTMAKPMTKRDLVRASAARRTPSQRLGRSTAPRR